MMHLLLTVSVVASILTASAPPGIPSGGGGGGLGGEFAPHMDEASKIPKPPSPNTIPIVIPTLEEDEDDKKERGDLKTIVVVSTDDYDILTQFQRKLGIKSDQVDAIHKIFSVKVAFESLRLEVDSWNNDRTIGRVELLDLIDRAMIKSKKRVNENEIAKRVSDNQKAAVENDRVDSVVKKLENEIAQLEREITRLRKK